MTAYAEQMFWLSKTVGDDSKQTNREALDKVAEHKKVDPYTLYDLPPIKREYLYILNWFAELRTGDQLTFTEIKAWSDLRKIELSDWEISTLFTLDSLLTKIQIHGKDKPTPKRREQKRRKSVRQS